MRKRFQCSLMAVIWIGMNFLFSGCANSIQKTKEVFLLPHQDDEMFMAGFIHRQVLLGKEVFVVLVTDGGASVAKETINRRLRKSKMPELSRQQFSAARNREWFASIQTLGVPADHILFSNSGGIAGSDAPVYKDNELTPELAKKAIDAVANQIGEGDYYTVAAELGNLNLTHGDHLALRKGLEETPSIKSKGFFSERVSGSGELIRLSNDEEISKREALRQYFVWHPELGRYAVASSSVNEMLWIRERLAQEYLDLK